MSGRKRISFKKRFEEKFELCANGCWEWTASLNQRSGYGQFRVLGSMTNAHRVSWEIYRGQIIGGFHVLHRCDNRKCVNPDHLFLGTHADNMDDMHNKGRGATRERHGRSKLTPSLVAEIKAMKGGLLQREIAAKFGVSQQQISHILRGVHWRTA